VDTFLSKGYNIVVENFNYICAPKGTPEELVKFVSDTIGSLMREGGLTQALIDTQQEANYMAHEEFVPYLKSYNTSMIDTYNKINADKKK
jgi:tripartite-type tricarboxylate transporter receptor subunit TctC